MVDMVEKTVAKIGFIRQLALTRVWPIRMATRDWSGGD